MSVIDRVKEHFESQGLKQLMLPSGARKDNL
jgi:hypothetical protein